MSTTATRTDPALWEKVKAAVTAGDKGGNAGEWSARKAQLAVAEYKKAGGGYEGRKDPHNSLHEWSEEEWGTRSGAKSGDTHERYLPKKARAALTDDEYRRTTAAKRKDRQGRQAVLRATQGRGGQDRAVPRPSHQGGTLRRGEEARRARTLRNDQGRAARRPALISTPRRYRIRRIVSVSRATGRPNLNTAMRLSATWPPGCSAIHCRTISPPRRW